MQTAPKLANGDILVRASLQSPTARNEPSTARSSSYFATSAAVSVASTSSLGIEAPLVRDASLITALVSSASSTSSSSAVVSGSVPVTTRVPLGKQVKLLTEEWSLSYLREAESGNAESQMLVAQMYREGGYGLIPRDEQQSERWLQAAAKQASGAVETIESHLASLSTSDTASSSAEEQLTDPASARSLSSNIKPICNVTPQQPDSGGSLLHTIMCGLESKHHRIANPGGQLKFSRSFSTNKELWTHSLSCVTETGHHRQSSAHVMC